MRKFRCPVWGLTLIVVMALVLAVVAVASSIPALAEEGPHAREEATHTATVTIPAGGWAAYNFNYRNGQRVGITANYSPVGTLAHQAPAVTIDAFQPADKYQDSIGSATQTAPGTLYYELSSKLLTPAVRSMIKNGKMDGQAGTGKYQLVVHNWDPQGRPVTVHLATSFVTRGEEGEIMGFRNGPVLHPVSSGQ